MKKYLFPALALGLVMTSCQSDEPFAPGEGGEKQVTFTLNVPGELGTRAVSGESGAQNNQNVDIYYTLVLDANGDKQVLQETTKEKTVTFTTPVVLGRKYDITAYASYTNNIDANASNIKAIAVEKSFNDETKDAYTAHVEDHDFALSALPTMQLKRPFGKLRLIATDYVETGEAKNTAIDQVTITYNNTTATTYDATTTLFNNVGTGITATKDFVKYYDAESDGMPIFADYLPANREDNPITFTVTVRYAGSTETYSRTFNDIPVRRNALTTLKGNFFTAGAEITVEVEDAFDNSEAVNKNFVSTASQLQEAIDNATPGETTEIILDGNIDLTQPIVFGAPSVNPAPAQTRSGATNSFVLNLNGKTISNPNGYAIENYSKLTISGEGNMSGLGGIRSHGGKLIIEGGNYTCSSNWSTGTFNHILKAENTEVVINDGTFDATVGGTNNAMINVSENSVVTINAGTFKNVNGVIPQFAPYMFTYEKNGKLIINGGDFYGGWRFNGETTTTDIYGGNFTVSYDGQSFHANSTHVLTIYGGTFSLENGGKLNPEKYVADGYKAIENGGKYYVVPNEFDAVATTADDLTEALANGGNVVLLSNINIDKIDLTRVTSDVVIDANGYTITTSDSYGIEATAGKNVTIKNATIGITKDGNYITYAAGFKIANGDYTGNIIKLENCVIKMHNADWAYAVTMPASVKNLNLVLDKCELEGAVAVQCWGDNNKIDITNSKLICNYTTSELYTSYCVALQGDGTNNSENNKLTIANCEFLYSGVDNFNSPIYAIGNNGLNNTISTTNCTYGEKIVK